MNSTPDAQGAPFRPGDKVRVDRNSPSAPRYFPRDPGLLCIRHCELVPTRVHVPAEQRRKYDWLVSIVGRKGFKPHRQPHSGTYNASAFVLVCPASPRSLR